MAAVSETTHAKTAAGKATTLAELRAFVAELDDLGAADDTRIEARGGLAGSRTLTAKITSRDAQPRPGARPFGQLDDDGRLDDHGGHDLWHIAAYIPDGREGEFCAWLAGNGVEVYRMYKPREELERQRQRQGQAGG